MRLSLAHAKLVSYKQLVLVDLLFSQEVFLLSQLDRG